ncbi:MAG: hypothetical protein COW63_00080 [Bacteroidetes bacterium CG18_big_fil_WC_8_21_14_2_50_41_14]|nr:MAG: hypothetical protein COW63_00080 [Bacteroidetes bacterium CG18_big_fil_WC_8_21_14_2_50_41_14]
MKKINFLIGLFMVVSLTFVFTSCKKDQNTVNETSSSSDDALAERIYDNVSNIADEAYSEKSGTLKSTDVRRLFLGDCVEISLDTVSVPHALIIDFGTENCLCNDGRYRRGKIIVSFTGRYRHPGTVITHGFDGYYVDDNKVEGTKVVTNMGFNADSNMYYQIEVVGVIFKANDGGTVSWTSSLIREWVEGLRTFTLWDDVYLISGTSSGIRADGQTWQRVTLTPLRKELGCRHFVSGTLEITPGERPIRILDYGTGECDNIATLLVNGVVYTIYLP